MCLSLSSPSVFAANRILGPLSSPPTEFYPASTFGQRCPKNLMTGTARQDQAR
jgi:hypothetical protein